MKVSYEWLSSYFDNLPSPEDVARALTFHAFEIESVEKSGEDTILDVKVLPNRAHDCLSHDGIVRELCAIFKMKLKDRDGKLRPHAKCFESEDYVSLFVESPFVRRAMKRIVRNISVGPSPEWMVRRLASLGQRSINNVVDATNYVTLEMGQPVHAFDYDTLAPASSAKSISIRPALDGERLTSLDGAEHILDQSILVISDSERALDIAGIKGGINSGISDCTHTLLLSVCNFDPVSIRKASRKLGIRTEASVRFEHDISPDMAEEGMERLTELIGAEAGSVIDIYSFPISPPRVSVNAADVNKLLGTRLSDEEVGDILGRLNLKWRLDINRPADLIEEVGRLYGYENLPSSAPQPSRAQKFSDEFARAESARVKFFNDGYSEIYSSSFAASGVVEIENPIADDKRFLRKNLSDGLRVALAANAERVDLLGLDEVKLFEIGTVFSSDGAEEVHAAWGSSGDMKIEERALPAVDCAAPDASYPLSAAIYKPFSQYPFIVRDISVWAAKDAKQDDIENIILPLAGPNFLHMRCFDKFDKDNRTSYAFRIVFQSMERTLTNDEISTVMEQITAALNERGYVVR